MGAVALDTMGNVAFGTSTGGITAKKPGRVGDSPIIGLFVNIIVFYIIAWYRCQKHERVGNDPIICCIIGPLFIWYPWQKNWKDMREY